MSAITLHRTDLAKNMRRFYRLDVQPDLFGQWCVTREWGGASAAPDSAHGVLYDRSRGARGACRAAAR